MYLNVWIKMYLKYKSKRWKKTEDKRLFIVLFSILSMLLIYACNHLFDLYQRAESGQERSCGLLRMSQNK